VAQPNQQPDSEPLPDSEIRQSEVRPSEVRQSDINPLLNPLLAANMGRWAEVYFTNPPEKRDQAIHQLLRELRGDSAVDAMPAAAEQPAKKETINAEESVGSFSPEQDHKCGACGHENPAGQRFCSMCGTPLLASAEAALPSREAATSTNSEESIPATEISSKEPEQSSTYGVDYPIRPAPRQNTLDGFMPAESSTRKDYPSFAMEPESRPYRYRIYIGAALAVIIGLLVYKAWHGTGALSSGMAPHSAISNAAPADVPEPVNPAPAAAPAANAPDNTAAADAKQEKVSAAPTPEKESPARPVATRAQISRTHIGRTLPAAERTPEAVTGPGQSGAEDFAVAERYLQPGAGGTRDSKEAAQWLWKAVGKGNVAATVTLSDLYLRGDGVPKSCDQGRLLLDAAARKGGSGAYERLRHLQAFGCE
jgi:zinc-ribbon domain